MHPDLRGLIRPGDGVLVGQACAEPQTLVEALVGQRAAYSGASVFLGINYAGIVKPEHADHLRLAAYCGAGHNRALADAGVLAIHPHPYSRIGELIRSRAIRADVVLVQVSPPNEKGEHSLGLAADYLVPALEVCRAVIAEVNDQVPWTCSERLLRMEDFALAVQTSRTPAPCPYAAPGETELGVARHCSPFIPDGATLEFGLGSLPEAVLLGLGAHRSIRVHSGALGEGIVAPMQSGLVADAVGAMLLGTRRLFDFVAHNPRVQLRSSEFTHNPRVLSAIERFVAINSAVEVDLTGQVNAEVAGGSYVGAVGGAPDFIRAANQSPGGVSLIVLPSTAAGRSSRIVAELSGPVTTPRSEAGVVVTEHGAADLRGLSLPQRAQRMIGIAAPAFRDGLKRQAATLRY